MIAKRLDAISEQDIQWLIANSVSEGKTIEYKRDLPGNSDAEKKEFLADVSSFANTSGGDVVYGVEEDKGVPIAIAGLAISDLDQETRRLDSILADGLEPRIRYEVKAIPLAENGKAVLVIRVERSWVGPHRVIFKSYDKFYARNSAGKYSLDVPELRAAFALSQTTIERARSFRVERIMAIADNKTPVPIQAVARLVIHCVPLESFVGSKQADVARFYGRPERIRSMNGEGFGGRINLEGFVCSGGNPPYEYTQLFRSGAVEVVDGVTLDFVHEGTRTIPCVAYEQRVHEYLPNCFHLIKEMGMNPPVVVALTLINVKGSQMSRGPFERGKWSAIDRDHLILPETIVETFDEKPGKVLKPMFDLVWNACGYPKSRNFDDEGNWVQR